MKTKHLLIFLIILSCSDKRCRLKIRTEFRNGNIKESCLGYGFDLLRDGKVVFTYPTNINLGLPDTTIENLPEGSYSVRYRGFFIKEIIQPVTLVKDSYSEIAIIPDSSNYSDEIKNSFIFNLENNEFVTCQINDNGCFNEEHFLFTIKRNDKGYTLIYGQKEVHLSKEDVDFLIRFECELSKLPKEYCTSSQEYILNYNRKHKTYTDMTCSWEGWERIRTRFGLSH